ncbi:hypothetical protein [Sciscionella sediminilitoris]|uniref:hypothetical protein n=1 Tax=Sciscionella sediminilitoris TaxID=1445613 RepID=UPI0004DF6DCA|nr:hypothetical protein [Sciscionella sp. SE31]
MTVIAVAPRSTERLATSMADCARVGASVLIPPPGARAAELAAIRTETGLLVAGEDVTLRHQYVLPEGDLHTVAELLRSLPGDAVPVLGGGVDVLLAALSAHAHLRVGSADTPDGEDPRLVAFAAGLARLSGRAPMSPDSAKILLGTEPVP